MRVRRWVEWAKDLLILLLTLSAAYLLTMTPLVQDSGVLDLIPTAEAPGTAVSGPAYTVAAIPARMAVNSPKGRYGLQYDQDGLDSLFARLGPLLGEALASAEEAEAIPESSWQVYLQNTGIYFDFSGEIPLSALSGWLGGTDQCQLEGSARRFLLAADGTDGVLLCWQDASSGQFYASSTALTQRFHLEPAAGDFHGNGAFFAFEDGEMSRLLKPYTLVTEEALSIQQYNAVNPLAAPDGVDALLDALDFSGQNHVAVNGGEVYLDSGDRLEISADGVAAYRAVQGKKYPVGTKDEPLSVSEAIEAARRLAESTVGSMSGDAQLYLISAQPDSSGYRVRFGYRLNGAAVHWGSKSWAAEFQVQNGCVAWFTLRFRRYTALSETTLLLPIDRAAVMLPDLTDQPAELVIRYWDQGGGVTQPEWVMD